VNGGKVVDEGQAAQEARVEADVVARTSRGVETAELAGARLQDPEAAAMHARRMRHGESFGDDAIVVDVDDDAAIGAMLAPAIDDVRRRAGGYVANAALLHSKPVEMTPVFRCELRNEFRLPHRVEGMRQAPRPRTR